MFLHADNEDCDQTGQIPRLIREFAGSKGHFVGFVMRRLILSFLNLRLFYLFHISCSSSRFFVSSYINNSVPHTSTCTVGSASDCRSRGYESEPQPSHSTFVAIDREIISTANSRKAELCQLLAKVCALSTG